MIPANFFTSHLEYFGDRLPSIINDEFAKREDHIINMNLDQLWDGKDIDGNDIRPFYSEDPYFKTKKQALAYKAWKQKITPNSKRNPDAPNLYITGEYYRSKVLQLNNDEIVFKTTSPLGNNIEANHKNIEGLNEEHYNIVVNDYIKPRLINELKEELSK